MKEEIVHIGASEDRVKKAAEKTDNIMDAHKQGQSKNKKKDQVVQIDMNEMDLSRF